MVMSVLLVCPIVSQTNISHYGITDGLADLHIKYLYQDTKGYLWIGTWDGISKFDGYRFTTFKHDPNDTTTIFADEVRQITEDSTGQIWAYTRHGLMRYTAVETRFQRVYLSNAHRQNIQTLNNQGLVFDTKGKGWFIAADGLYCFTPDLKSIRRIDLTEVTHLNQNCLLADSSGIWLLSYKGLFHFSFDVLQKQRITKSDADRFFSFDIDLKEFGPHQLFKTANGRLLAQFSHYGLFMANEQTGKMELIVDHIIPGIDNRISELRAICEPEPGKLMFGAENSGIVIYEITSKQFLQNHPIQQIAKNQRINCILKDKQHNIWFGGVNGLYKYEMPQLLFEQWLSGDENENSIKGSFLSSIYLDDKYTWLGTSDGGLQKINKLSNEIEPIRLPAKFQLFCNDTKAYCVYPYDENHLLVNFDASVFLYNKAKGRFIHLLNVKGHVYKFYKLDDETIWFTDGSKLFSLTLDSDNQDIKPIIEEKLQFSTFHRDILVSENKNVFLAGQRGLRMYDNTNLEHGEIFIPTGAETIPELVCMHETDAGLLWLGTLRYGIYLFDPGTGTFLKHFDESNGLIDNSVNVIFEDGKGFLWMSTWKGISRFDPTSETFQNYSTVNGLPFPEFNTQAYATDALGRYYFGGIGGLIRFHPDSLVKFNTTSPPLIHEIRANMQHLTLDYPLRDGDMVNLAYDQHSFALAFGSLDFRAPDQRIYRYRLNGLQNNWILHQSSDLTARYSGLKPALYVFELQSTYRNWSWPTEITRVMINVAGPPLLQRQSFQLILLISFVASLLALVLLRMRNASIRKEMLITRLEKESNLSRLNFLKSQMNPHFYFNTLNAINNFVLKNDARSANKYLTRFARLMREILENSQKEFVTIEEEKKILENYLSLQQLRFIHTFDYSIHCEDQVKGKGIPPMLIQPFVENAIEYAFVDMPVKGFVSVKFEQQNKSVLCTICDNGIGIKKSQILRAGRKRQSAAIKNIRQRIEMLNSVYKLSIKLEISTCEPANENFPGTRVKLLFPEIAAS